VRGDTPPGNAGGASGNDKSGGGSMSPVTASTRLPTARAMNWIRWQIVIWVVDRSGKVLRELGIQNQANLAGVYDT